MPRIIVQQSGEERAVWAHRGRDHGAQRSPRGTARHACLVTRWVGGEKGLPNE